MEPPIPSWFQQRPVQNTDFPETGPLDDEPLEVRVLRDRVNDQDLLRYSLGDVLDVFHVMLREQLQPLDDSDGLWQSAINQCAASEFTLYNLVPMISRSRLDSPRILTLLSENEKQLELVQKGLVAVESAIAAREFHILAFEERDFLAYASRFERARLRHTFKQVFDRLRTPQLMFAKDRLKSFEMEELPVLSIQHAVADDLCAICHCDVDEEDVSMVATPCCRKPFHSSCLLTWLLSANNRERTCCYCRTPVDLNTLGQILEVSTRAMRIL